MPRRILLDFGQLLYYAEQGYDWDQVEDRVLRAEAVPPPPEPEPDDEPLFEDVDWLRRR
ncbi:hypothetical protein LWP59_22895 [Amycolatopsis acidiphila]|uniref:hypothetical protein n=1 Tax=Amycolatopsis acidiphila TaxID=715473 RepID=UPI001643DF53|nr:hypothetical protein [Amycolatopsis acidiphila]UIJ57005.1 hypothetical protein LWP59_22895 [Amycolatopsis acidiphila]GHG53875.1 hypothetical protein GCM10017788_02990 [Amycolatopsis acidiphila]